MILDQTFCSGLRCSRRSTCGKWIRHLHDWAETQPELRQEQVRARKLSIAQFGDHDGNCTRYSPIEEKGDGNGLLA